jgi:hypothetical protein
VRHYIYAERHALLVYARFCGIIGVFRNHSISILIASRIMPLQSLLITLIVVPCMTGGFAGGLTGLAETAPDKVVRASGIHLE